MENHPQSYFQYTILSNFRGAVQNGSVFSPKRSVSFYLPDLDLERGDFIQNRIFLEQDYFEIDDLRKISEYIPHHASILDIGANIGNHTLYFAIECEAKHIYSFEPIEYTFNILKKNIELNRLGDRSTVYNAALGETDGRAMTTHFEKNDLGGTVVTASENGDIRLLCLDSLDLPQPIDFVKIDVEGFECNVLLGGKEFFQANSPVIYIEIFDQNYEKASCLLESFGYRQILKESVNYIFQKQD